MEKRATADLIGDAPELDANTHCLVPDSADPTACPDALTVEA